ncbi:hypothetical protein SBA2_30055 [Acidobacteriia bacterium SbA2]|nr:hypothetical protein SBA2_30055 [Acidobacteriia bacterium SbA2]
MGYWLPPAPRAQFFNELLTHNTSRQGNKLLRPLSPDMSTIWACASGTARLRLPIHGLPM